jgi:uncharacterized protein (DUF302 family)
METLTKTSLGSTIRMPVDFDSALRRVTEALKAEGFGVLTEIDVKETMKKKLGVDFRRYKILGACNPPLAHRALSASPEVGLLLPCNVTVAEPDPASANGTQGKWTEVSLIDPLAMLGVVPNPELHPIAEEAKARLDRVAAALNR